MIPRHLLPQIPEGHLDSFREFLFDHGVKTKLDRMSAKSLKPIQQSVNQEKIEKMKKNLDWLATPIIISKGGYVLDGHHRWAAANEIDPDMKVVVLWCDCPMKKLIKLGHFFDESSTKTVFEWTDFGKALFSDDAPKEEPLSALMVRKTLKPY